MQQPLWHDNFEDALRDAIVAIGGIKTVATEFWPDKTQESAVRLLNHCLNVDRDEKLSPAQIMIIWSRSAAAGCHVLAAFVGHKVHYEFKPVTPEERQDELKRQFIAAVGVVQHIGKQLGVVA